MNNPEAEPSEYQPVMVHKNSFFSVITHPCTPPEGIKGIFVYHSFSLFRPKGSGN